MGFDFKGDVDGTRERMERLSRDDVIHRAAELFAPNASFSVPGQTRAFNCMNPPPQVKISIVVPDAFYPVPVPSSELIHLWKDSFVGTSGVLPRRAVVEPPNLIPPRSTCLPLDTKYSKENTKLHSSDGHTPGENPKIHIFAIRIINERIKLTLFNHFLPHF